SGFGVGLFGQNQAVRATATGAAPTSTAQGLKIEQTNMTVTAAADVKGQVLGSALGSRTSGRASITLVSSNSRSSTRRPWTTAIFSPESQSGALLSTCGI